jgi:phospholipid-translocating ATPase
MRHFGFAFIDRDEDENIVIDFRGQKLHYKLLHVLEFTSDRKRMSVIVRTPENQVMLVCKGADSVINPRLIPGQSHEAATNDHLERFAEAGLRTLLIAYRYIEEPQYQEWLAQFAKAQAATSNREQKVAELAAQVEVDFLLAGCSAIEDKLQEDVGKTIEDIRKADIKVWVLTGDKVETAINIG